jgi:hypothetical protein
MRAEEASAPRDRHAFLDLDLSPSCLCLLFSALLSNLRRHIDNFNRRLPALCLLQEILQIRRCLIVDPALAALFHFAIIFCRPRSPIARISSG